MLLQVENTKDGYVVSGYFNEDTGYSQWRPLMNFGQAQGDALWACHTHLPKMDELGLKRLADRYDKNIHYHISGLASVRVFEHKTINL